MIFKKDELKKVSSKNYYIVLFVSLFVIVLTLYIRTLYLNYQTNKADNSVFVDKSINQINVEDIDYALDERNDVILFVSYNGDKYISSMERRLNREVKKKELNDMFFYLNISDYLDGNDYINLLRDKFPDNKDDFKKAPLLIYIRNGRSLEVIDSSNRLVSYKDLNTLLSKYGIE